jgi:tetratricopeptide (TPR) repeat protein
LAPLINTTGDTALDYLAAGVAEAISGRLASSGRVALANRPATVSRAAVGAVLEEGRIRGADAVLAGRLVRQGPALALDVDLIRVADGSRAWSERLALPLRDVLLVEDRITEAVLSRLDTVRGSVHRDGIRRARPADHEAHLLLLRGWHANGERTPDGFRRARDLFLRALARDPVYAEAYAGLGAAYHGLAHYGAMAGREAFPRARAAALRALEIDSMLAQARTGLAAVRTFHDWDFPAAEREYREALRADPSDPVTHNFYGIHLRVLKRFDEAAREMAAASRLDPLARVYVRQLGLVHFCAGDYSAALAEFRRALQLEPGGHDAHWLAIETLAQMGWFDAALEQWRSDTVRSLPDRLRMPLAQAHGRDGYRRVVRLDARLELEAMRAAREYVSPTAFARTHGRLEQWDSAFAWLDRAIDDRDPSVLKVGCEPEFMPIRSHPRMVGLLRRLGLP